jgi:twinkle protein
MKKKSLAEFDKFVRFQEGYLTTITGVPGHGKSEFLDFILCRLNVSHGWKTALYSPENHPLELHFSKFAEKMIGKPYEGGSRMSKAELDYMIKYHSENFYFINPEDDFSLENILKSVKSLVRKHGIKAFVLDAWNKLDHKYSTNETQYISKQLDEIVKFCERNKVHCFLVAHPTKIRKDDKGLYEIPNLYNISGSANFYNKTANGITVYRNFDTGQTEIYIQKVKFKHWGETGCCIFAWNRDNGRYYKGTPDNESWISKIETNTLQQNNDFLSQRDIVINNLDNPF